MFHGRQPESPPKRLLRAQRTEGQKSRSCIGFRWVTRILFCLFIAGNDNYGDFLGGTFNQSLHPPTPPFSGF